MVIKRGDIFFADLRPVVGSEQGGVRPVLIIQNDMGNRHNGHLCSYYIPHEQSETSNAYIVGHEKI